MQWPEAQWQGAQRFCLCASAFVRADVGGTAASSSSYSTDECGGLQLTVGLRMAYTSCRISY